MIVLNKHFGELKQGKIQYRFYPVLYLKLLHKILILRCLNKEGKDLSFT